MTAPATSRAPAFEAPFTLPKERGVHRCTGWIPGLVTYFAVTSLGDVLRGEFRFVKPGAVAEARVVADLTELLDTHDGHLKTALKLHRPGDVGGRLSSSVLLSPHRAR